MGSVISLSKFLLDTHVFLWWIQGSKELPLKYRRLLHRDDLVEQPLLVSDISLWEIALLVQEKRIRLNRPLRDWLEDATSPPLVERVHISPAVVHQMILLPESFHKDPADRIIVASALVHGARLLTCDQRIIRSRIVDT